MTETTAEQTSVIEDTIVCIKDTIDSPDSSISVQKKSPSELNIDINRPTNKHFVITDISITSQDPVKILEKFQSIVGNDLSKSTLSIEDNKITFGVVSKHTDNPDKEAEALRHLSQIGVNTLECIYPAPGLSSNVKVLTTLLNPYLRPLLTAANLFDNQIELFEDALNQIATMHSAGRFHGDLWLKNICIDDSKEAGNQVYLVDLEDSDLFDLSDNSAVIKAITNDFEHFFSFIPVSYCHRNKSSSAEWETTKIHAKSAINNTYIPLIRANLPQLSDSEIFEIENAISNIIDLSWQPFEDDGF